MYVRTTDPLESLLTLEDSPECATQQQSRSGTRGLLFSIARYDVSGQSDLVIYFRFAFNVDRCFLFKLI